jgi:hypothetical protein
MVDLKNAIEILNEVIIVPIAIITFLILMYIVVYLNKKDPDVIRSRIFLRYEEFKRAFFLLAAFAFVLILHVSLIYIPHFYSLEESPLIEDFQKFFGLTLAVITITFVFYLYKSIK